MILSALAGVLATLGMAPNAGTADLAPAEGTLVYRKRPPADPSPDPDRPKKPRREMVLRKDPPPPPDPGDRPKKPRRGVEFWLTA